MKRAKAAAWTLAAVLAVLVIGGIGILALQWRGYWLAKYHGPWADLRGADLRETNISYVTLDHAWMQHANLRGAAVWRCSLRHASLREADLTGANLTGSRLDAADLTHARFRGARYDRFTRWLAGFDPRQHGLVRQNGSEDDLE